MYFFTISEKEREQSKIQADHKTASSKLQKADGDLSHLTSQIKQKKAELKGKLLFFSPK